MATNCKTCVHKKVCDLWRSQECQSAKSFFEDECELYAEVPRWIPATDADNLPKKSTPCLVACNQWGGEKVRKATYLDSEKRFFEGGFDITEYVTHWMPSPEPPKEESDDSN